MEIINLKIRNKIITSNELELIRSLISQYADKGRSFISKELCQIWDWRQANGAFREIACRDMLRQLEKKNYIKLPPSLSCVRKSGYKCKTFLPKDLDTNPINKKLSALNNITIKIVSSTPIEKDYNGLIDKYHYLGFKLGSGEQLKYIVFGDSKYIGAIGFDSSALKVSDREKYIGWNREEKAKNLFKIINNTRFLIMPWVRVPNLASYILGKISRRIRQDWLDRYNHEIVLLETFIEKNRFKGSCYKAANWKCIGETKGRGRNDRYNERKLAVKDIYIYPLTKYFKRSLHE